MSKANKFWKDFNRKTDLGKTIQSGLPKGLLGFHSIMQSAGVLRSGKFSQAA